MKRDQYRIAAFVMLTALWTTSARADIGLPRDDVRMPVHTVNAVLEDASFASTFGELPNARTNETLRLTTHLAYVETILRAVDTTDWPGHLREARERNLDILHEYRTAGVFPTNRAYPDERRPCFIDDDGNVCAVGYIIEQTAGRDLAEAINERYQYAFLPDMQMEAIGDWVAASGLTAIECAMIQPCYGPDNLWRPYELDFGDGIAFDAANPLDALVFDVPDITNRLDIVSGVRLTLDISHARVDDLTVILANPDTVVPSGQGCVISDGTLASPSVTTTFLLGNDAPLGGETSLLDGVYEWTDAATSSIEDGAAGAAGGVISPGSYSSVYSSLSEYTTDVVVDEYGFTHGAWSVGEWVLNIADLGLEGGVIRGATLEVRISVIPAPCAFAVIALGAVIPFRRRRQIGV